jgi:hypothetical protein
MTDVTTVLAGEDAAVYAYGLAAARLSGTDRTAALDAMAVHRGQRDRLAARAAASGASPSPMAAAYDPPFPITDVGAARRLAALVEDRLAGQWAGLAASSSGQQRLADALVGESCAVRSTTWSGLAPVWNGAV